MNKRWFLSQFFVAGTTAIPICSAYGQSDWQCPTMPADLTAGWALVLMSASAHQIDAAKQDSARVIVRPRLHSAAVLATGVWTATGLVSFQSYGIAPRALLLDHPKLRTLAMSSGMPPGPMASLMVGPLAL
jgi:hypothetical protein